MPARVLEVALIIVTLTILGVFLFIAANPSVLIHSQVQELNSLKAKQALSALEKYPTTSKNEEYEGMTIFELIRYGYLQGDQRAYNQAEQDIKYYFDVVMSLNRWRVFTSDGAVDVSSPGFSSSRTVGSAKTNVISDVFLYVQVG